MASLMARLVGMTLPAWITGVCVLAMLGVLQVNGVRVANARADASQARASEARAQAELADLKSRAARVISQQIRAAMERERELRADQERALNALQTYRLAAVGERSRLEQRLRDTAATYADSHRDRPDLSTDAAATCSRDAPPAARLSEATRSDLAGLAADADDVVVTLTACQELLSKP